MVTMYTYTAQIVQHGQDFIPFFAQAHHQAALGQGMWVQLLGHAQDLQAPLVSGLGPHPARERGTVSVLWFRFSGCTSIAHFSASAVALHFGDEHFDGCGRASAPKISRIVFAKIFARARHQG